MRLLTLFLAASSALPAAETYRVAGVIVDSETASPIANASISLSPYAQSRNVMAVISGADGGFAFDAPRGKYVLSAVIAGRSELLGETGPFTGLGEDVITGPDQDSAHLVFRWRRPAAIAGRVVDDQEEPVAGAMVRLLHPGVTNGHVQTAEVGQTQTDDRGEYRFWGIPGANYYVEVTAQPWWHSEPPLTYGAVYYPGTGDASRAALLTVRPGEEARADFTLTAEPAATVTVNCGNCDAETAAAVNVSLAAEGLDGTSEVAAAQMVQQWPATVNTVPPGRYLVRLSSGNEADARVAEQWVDVGPGETAVSLSLHAGAVVSGKVTVRNGSAGSLILSRDPFSQQEATPIAQDGTFRFGSVPAGQYHVVIPGSDIHPETIEVADELVADGVVNIRDGVETKLSIVANSGSGAVKGFAVRDGRPAANMLVVLVPTGAAGGYPNQGWQTDSDGSFDWTSMRAGDYLLFAVDDPGIAFADADAIKPYLARAKPIHIEPGKTYEERVPVQASAK